MAILNMSINGCDQSQSDQEQCKTTQKSASIDLAVKGLDDLYNKYLHTTPEIARECLLAVDNHIAALDQGREGLRFLKHARLHCLLKALNRDEEAYLEFIKVRYWWLMEREMGRAATREITKRARELTERECDRMVIEFDRDNTDGKHAQYWQALPGGPVAPDEWLDKTYGPE
jgi:hypothetical protein